MFVNYIMEAIIMGKFGVGIFAGTILGMSIAMLDKRTMKKAKKMAKSMAHNMTCCR